MLSASRLLVREARVPCRVGSLVGSESMAVSATKVSRGCRVSRQYMRKSAVSGQRSMATKSRAQVEEEAQIALQNNAPVQPANLTVENVSDTQPEYDQLRQFLPSVVLDEELSAVDARVRRFKANGKQPNVADSLWLILANMKKNKLDAAVVSWHDLVTQVTPDILHWNLMLVHLAKAKNYALLSEVYEHFKLAVIKRKLPGPVPMTYNILLKAFSERGDVEKALEIYEDFFNNRWIPEVYHIQCVAKAAALGGDPRNFHRFVSRLIHKGVKIDGRTLRDFVDLWGRFQLTAEQLKKTHVTTGDYSSILTYALRVHNYRRAFDLIHDCRDNLGIQPDARMYEVVLSAMIRDGFCRERARALKKRFHKYPKGIEVREEHFEFNELFETVIAQLGKEANRATPADMGERIKFARTTRKMSSKLYNGKPSERYVSGWEYDEFEWVPEYVQRKKELKLAQEQAAKAEELQSIIKKAKSQSASL